MRNARSVLPQGSRSREGAAAVTPDLPLWIAGIAIALAVPVTFMVANWVRKNVDHGELRFGPDGKVIEDEEPRGEG
jgi:hypothetical protein